MNINIPYGFTFQGLYCYPNPEQPLSYYYLPSTLQPQRDTAGKPLLMLVPVGSGAYLQLSVFWDAAPAILDALRQEIARRNRLDNSDVLRLAFAPVTVTGVSLVLGDGNGNLSELQQARSSGAPPYNTLFNLSLNPTQQAQVAAALNGREQMLQIHYNVSLEGFVTATATLRGDATNAIASLKQEHDAQPEHLPENEQLQQLQAQLQAGILRGDLQLNVNADDNAPDLLERVQARVLNQAADLLLRFLEDETQIADITRLEVGASLTEPIAIALPLQTDVATWLQPGTGAEQITPAPGITPQLPGDLLTTSPDSLPPAAPKTLTVQLDFPARDAPLSLIQVRQGSGQATLTPPGFTAVKLPLAGGDGLVSVMTSYTTGESAYECQTAIQDSSDLALTPGHLGLVLITIDACLLEQAGAKRARIRVRYQPENQGIADEHTFYFRDPDWQANWFLVSRSNSLAGILAYEWQVTTATEELIKHEWTETMSPHIVLRLGA